MATRCFHCHEPVPDGFALTVPIDGQARAVCCHGCAAVAEMITGSGLTRFYQLREAPAPRPDDSSADWSIFDRPAMLETIAEPRGEGRHEVLLSLAGINCAACSWLIESKLLDFDGLEGLSINVATGRARITLEVDRTPLSEVLAALDELGYRPQPVTEEARLAADRRERRAALRRLAVAGLGMMQVMTYAVAIYAGHFQDMDIATRDFFRFVSLLIATPVVLYSGWPFLRGAWRGVRHRRPGMDLPVAIAILGAYGASAWNTFTGGREVYFDSAVMFVFLLSIVRWIEMRLRHRSAEVGSVAGQGLPAHALRRRGAEWQRVAVTELEQGDCVRVAAGETIPVDGTLQSLTAETDESVLTGESRPVLKQPGDGVIAGSLLVTGPADIRVERVGSDTVFSSIRRLLERARAERPSRIALADRLARYLVLGVLALAAATATTWWFIDPGRAFEATLAVLVITCPCALSLATPAVLSAAMAALARRGVLVVDADALERITEADRIVFDKTGTLTTGTMRVRDATLLGSASLSRCLSLAAALEQGSAHPVASAFGTAEPCPPVERLRAVPAQGMEGFIDGQCHRIGTGAFVQALLPDGSAPVAGADGLFLGSESGLLARFELGEEVRPDAPTALTALGMPATVLSGDAEAAVRTIAGQLDLSDFHWRQSPEDKLAYVRDRQQQGECIVMVGDGNNDAPVLAQADVSVTLGSGSALAHREGDVIVVSHALAPLADLFRTAARARRLIAQNLCWALAYNLTAVPLAATGLVAPWLAAVGMSASSLLVVLNSLRAARTAAPPTKAVQRPAPLRQRPA